MCFDAAAANRQAVNAIEYSHRPVRALVNQAKCHTAMHAAGGWPLQ